MHLVRFVSILTAFAALAATNSAAQVQKKFVIGQRNILDPERKDGKVDGPALNAFLKRIADRIAIASATKPPEIHVTRSTQEYARLISGRLYLSIALLQRMDTEAELAGFLAYSETSSIALAMSAVKRAGYDPSEMLTRLSRLAYENPSWSPAIDPAVLLDFRSTLESEPLPLAGYQVDSSEFRAQHARLTGLKSTIIRHD